MWVGWVAMFGMSQWHTRRSTFQEEANHLALSAWKKKEVNACCKFRFTSRALISWRGKTFSGGHLSWQSKHGAASFEEESDVDSRKYDAKVFERLNKSAGSGWSSWRSQEMKIKSWRQNEQHLDVHLSQLEDQSYRSTGDGGGWENHALISQHGFDEFRRRFFTGTSRLKLTFERGSTAF